MNPQIIETFRQLLIEYDIPFTEHPLYGGIQWRFPFTEGDVAYHAGTYHNDTCVESYHMPWDRGDSFSPIIMTGQRLTPRILPKKTLVWNLMDQTTFCYRSRQLESKARKRLLILDVRHPTFPSHFIKS